MNYQLKPGVESFEIMGGPDEGKKFVRGRTYAEIPAGYEDRFERGTDRKEDEGIARIPSESPDALTMPDPKPLKKKARPTALETPPTDAGDTDNIDIKESDK